MLKKLWCAFAKQLAKLVFPRREVKYASVPKEGEPVIFVSNHSGAVAPANMTMSFGRDFRPWSIHCLYNDEIAPNYIYHDFFFGRSKKHKKFYRMLSKVIAPLLRPLLEMQDPVIVYRGSSKMFSTFRDSVDTLVGGKDLVIYGESFEKYTENVNRLYSGFTDIGRLYYNQTGREVEFYPVFVPPKRRVILVGEPVRYDASADKKAERERIASVLEERIDKLGRESGDTEKIPFMQECFYEYYPEFVDDADAYWRFVAEKYSE